MTALIALRRTIVRGLPRGPATRAALATRAGVLAALLGFAQGASAQGVGHGASSGDIGQPEGVAARGDVDPARPDRPRKRSGDETFGFRRRTREGEVYAYGQRYGEGLAGAGRFKDAYGTQPWPLTAPRSAPGEAWPADPGTADPAEPSLGQFGTPVEAGEPGDLTPDPKPRRKPKPPSRLARPQPLGIGGDLKLDAVPNEVLLELRPGVPATALVAVTGRFRLTQIGAQRLDVLDTTIYRCLVPAGLPPGSILPALRRDARVASAQSNGKFRLQEGAAGSKSPALPWSADRLKLAAVHGITTGRDVLIAVIDSGVDIAHPELAGGDIRLVDTLDTPFAAHDHGTAIAGALVSHGQMIGVAPGARLLGIRAFDAGASQPGAEGTSLHIAKALDAGDRAHAKVFNLSFAGPKDDLLGRIFAVLRRKGDIIVAAAGNADSDSPPLYPAADENVIAVTATDSKDRVFGPASRGSFVRIAAPGVDMLEPAPRAAYRLTSGTSVAAAEVSGMVALLLARHPELDTAAVRELLIDTADPTATAPEQGGAGLIDPVRAVERLDLAPQPAGASAPVPGVAPGANDAEAAEPRRP